MTRPARAIAITLPPETAAGSAMRENASTKSQSTTPSITRPFTNAAMTSTRPWPKLCPSSAPFIAMRLAMSAKKRLIESVSMWPASPMRASELESHPPASSTAEKPSVSATAKPRTDPRVRSEACPRVLSPTPWVKNSLAGSSERGAMRSVMEGFSERSRRSGPRNPAGGAMTAAASRSLRPKRQGKVKKASAQSKRPSEGWVNHRAALYVRMEFYPGLAGIASNLL